MLNKTNFEFVDTIRCISMIGIVFEHCTQIGEDTYVSLFSEIVQASVMQIFKFATIIFFIIGGFLINYKFTEYTPVEYLKNRVKSTIGPWFFWFNVFVLYDISSLLYKKYVIYKGNYEMSIDLSDYIVQQYHQAILFSSYWFVLNFLVCIFILLLFKKYLYNVYFGLILGMVSLFYSVNLYYGWIITAHSTALLGFVFYLWLGVIINKYYKDLERIIQGLSIWYFICITAFFFLLADVEILCLKNLYIKDAYNTLRISNILYSLSFFFLLLKIGSSSSINSYLKPKKTTFGIYLIHQIVTTYLLLEIFRPFKIHVDDLTLFSGIIYSILRFLLTYLISIVLVFVIGKTKFKWSVGLSN